VRICARSSMELGSARCTHVPPLGISQGPVVVIQRLSSWSILKDSNKTLLTVLRSQK